MDRGGFWHSGLRAEPEHCELGGVRLWRDLHNICVRGFRGHFCSTDSKLQISLLGRLNFHRLQPQLHRQYFLRLPFSHRCCCYLGYVSSAYP